MTKKDKGIILGVGAAALGFSLSAIAYTSVVETPVAVHYGCTQPSANKMTCGNTTYSLVQVYYDRKGWRLSTFTCSLRYRSMIRDFLALCHQNEPDA